MRTVRQLQDPTRIQPAQSAVPRNSPDGLAISSLPAATKVPNKNIAFKQVGTKACERCFWEQWLKMTTVVRSIPVQEL